MDVETSIESIWPEPQHIPESFRLTDYIEQREYLVSFVRLSESDNRISSPLILYYETRVDPFQHVVKTPA